MIRLIRPAQCAAFALLAGIALSACRSTDCACNGGSDAQAESLPKPEIGLLVRLYLDGGTEQVIGTVTSVDDEFVRIKTVCEGQLVADWSRVAAWESGAAVDLSADLLPSLAELQEYSRRTNEMISDVATKLPGQVPR